MRAQIAVVFCVLLAVSPAMTAAATPQTEPPLPDAGLDQTVRQGATVHLDATGSRDPDGEISSYEWHIDAPDGTATTPECVTCARTTFVAAQTGTYSVTVEVTGDEGTARSDTLYVTVEPASDAPTVSLSGPTRPTVGSESRYTASFTDGDAPVETLVWRVDGKQVAKRDAEADTTLDRVFETRTPRTVTVIAYDGNGREASDELTVQPRDPDDTPRSEASTGTDAAGPVGTPDTSEITVSSEGAPSSRASQPTPSLTLSGPTTVFAGESHTYTASTDDVPAGADIGWRAGDEGSRVTRRWDETGTHTVAASTTAHGTEVSDSLTVEVIDPSIEIDGPTEVTTGVFASFSARTSGVPDDATLRWDNGETGDTTGRKWSTPGTYTIKVTTTVAGRTISDTHTVNVTELAVEDRNQPPKVDIDDPGSLTAGEDVTLTATYSDPDGRVVDVEWNPGQTVTVPEPGLDVTVDITVTDNDGAKATDEITLQTIEKASTVEQENVECYYKSPSEKTRKVPSGGCKASWGESWSQSEIATQWHTTVGQYDVTWIKIEETNSGTHTTETGDPGKECQGCTPLADSDSDSNPTNSEQEGGSSNTEDTLGSYTKNGKTVHNDLTGDGVVNVIDWNQRFDNGYVDGPGGGSNNINGAGPSLAVRGANGQQAGSGSAPGGGLWSDDITASNSGDSNSVTNDADDSHGGDDVPNAENADPGGTNGQVDANTDNGFSRSEGQSVKDYKEEFTARLELDI